MIDESTIQKVLDVADIVDVIQDFQKLTKRGASYECCCPVHNEKTPSFKASKTRNTFKCFSCGVGGNVISYLTKVEKMTFPEAIKYLGNKYGITVEEDKPMTDEQRLSEIRREAMLNTLQQVQEYYAERLTADDAAKARSYIANRWGEKYAIQEGLGYAPDGWQELKDWAQTKAISREILLELGLLKKKDGTGKIYDFFRNRVVIPIRDKYARVIGFTARDLSGEQAKYMNSSESLVYSKSKSIFGIHNASKTASADGIFYLVEGGPDVLKLQSIGINNTIAALGTAWTTAHFEQLKRYNAELCFIPDIDKVKEGEKFGAGINAVIRNGLAALDAGFKVSVKEIKPEKAGEKIDPDSYITSKAIFATIDKEDFIIWYANKIAPEEGNPQAKAEAIKTIATILAKIDDAVLRLSYVDEVRKIYGGTAASWRNAINNILQADIENDTPKREYLDRAEYAKYGFFERNNCYFSIANDAERDKEWSNFTMEPLYHIKDSVKPKRLYRIKNVNGDTAIIELAQEDLCSLQRFKVRVEGEGNFIWKTNEADLTKLKSYLYEKTDSANEIKQLGWSRKGYYAFGNGVIYNGEWKPVDENGIVKLGEIGNVYIPASSNLFKDYPELFQFERRFVLTNYSAVSLDRYVKLLIDVFGDNAKIGFCFFLAALFKDVVTYTTKNFPILNLYGPQGSGKSELGHSLMSFFIIRNDPPNLSTSTLPGLAEAVAQCSNALVHIDEYKNSIELERREFIKSIYDNVGRTRINMDRDKKKETTRVDSAVIISGQERPVVDIAILSRMIHLTFNKNNFGMAEKRKFDEMKEVRERGCSHLIIQLLKHRAKFEAEFAENYKAALSDVCELLEKGNRGENQDRIIRNWVIALAAYRTLIGVLDVPFTYQDILKICVEGIQNQNIATTENNEIGNFWNAVDFLHQNGEVFIDADYKIRYIREFKGRGMSEKMTFSYTKPVLYLCIKRIIPLYKKYVKTVGEETSVISSLRYYLETSPEYIGTAQAVRFKCVVNTREAFQVDMKGYQGKVAQTSRIDQALCFDYEQLRERFGINLEVEVGEGDDIDFEDIDTSDESLPYKNEEE